MQYTLSATAARMNAIAALKSTRRICFDRITNPQRKAEKDTNYERIECIKHAAGAEARRKTCRKT